jgi:3-isopropylmalate/(R)-2-methylmalate dehydratase large subunit
MAMTMIEKIVADHSGLESVSPGDIVDVAIDARVARDFGGANVVKHLKDHDLDIENPGKTYFTFDCNPSGSDQKYAVNQHICRLFSREKGITVYDIDKGIGTHLLIDEGIVYPGSTAVSTDSHANILGAIGAFGQGMGDMDIASAWSKGKVWFKVPESVRINLKGKLPENISSKDLVLNLLGRFGANSLLGFSVEIYGEAVETLSLDDRITISSMATEMGAIIIFFPPSEEVIKYCSGRALNEFRPVYADHDARYSGNYNFELSGFKNMVSRPGEPHDTVDIDLVRGVKIDSAFIGSCTNGRMNDLIRSARLLKGRVVAPGVVLKIVPATDGIWKQCLSEGLIELFKKAGALVSNAGCAGCAAGQVGQNGQGEVTISTGNRNFPGKQGKGSVYLASPEVVAASAIAGFITSPDKIPEKPALFATGTGTPETRPHASARLKENRPVEASGRVWLIKKDNIDTDMIFHNRYLAITVMKEMGQYTFDNLKGYEDFARKVKPGDIVVAGKNFGSGSSRQQAVDCFMSLGVGAIVAESFGAIYERNAVNAAFPVMTCRDIDKLELKDGDDIKINFLTGTIYNLKNDKTVQAEPFSRVQLEIYNNGGLL